MWEIPGNYSNYFESRVKINEIIWIYNTGFDYSVCGKSG